MSAKIIDGKAIAEEIRNEVKELTRDLKSSRGITPGLGFILVGNNPASEVYVSSKAKACAEMGFYSVTEKMPEETTESDLLRKIKMFNNDSKIHGILVQLPLPKHINEIAVIESISPAKDVDGFTPVNVGRLVIGEKCFIPCTPGGIQTLIERSGIDVSGRHVVVIGRSNIVGKPVANLLLQKRKNANAVVTVAHTAARDISYYTRQADILVAAMGKPQAITGDMLRPGVVVIDVGTNRIPDQSKRSGYRLVGDVHFDSAKEIASAITPVPGGVGPMTIAMLMKNTYLAAAGEIY
ncbi:MAG: bifunctional 5,10-methylenetetrahydrofolate dehydrogenase/5,10-methenyltetrahydrofolate cyclohydrolase [Candidatus Kryptoniota bacterium]